MRLCYTQDDCSQAQEIRYSQDKLLLYSRRAVLGMGFELTTSILKSWCFTTTTNLPGKQLRRQKSKYLPMASPSNAR